MSRHSSSLSHGDVIFFQVLLELIKLAQAPSLRHLQLQLQLGLGPTNFWCHQHGRCRKKVLSLSWTLTLLTTC